MEGNIQCFDQLLVIVLLIPQENKWKFIGVDCWITIFSDGEDEIIFFLVHIQIYSLFPHFAQIITLFFVSRLGQNKTLSY